jgi:hypothetical protein
MSQIKLTVGEGLGAPVFWVPEGRMKDVMVMVAKEASGMTPEGMGMLEELEVHVGAGMKECWCDHEPSGAEGEVE